MQGDALEADGETPLRSHCSMTLDAGAPLRLRNPPGSSTHSEVLLLQVTHDG